MWAVLHNSCLIDESKQLKSFPQYQSSIYFFEPFYQLMRQTLWAEQMILHQKDDSIKASNYLHLHIIPAENRDLLNKNYLKQNRGMEQSWRDCLANQTKYEIVDPGIFLSPIAGQYPELYAYLEERYW